MRTPRHFIKWMNFVVPLVPGLYKIHLIMQTLAGLLHKIVRHRWLIHQMDIILTLVRIVLPLVSLSCIVQQGRALLERCLRSAQWYEYAVSCLLEIYRKPPK